MILALIAYWLVSVGRIKGRGYLYQWLNIWGGICLGVNAWHHSASPGVALNAIWAGTGVWTLWSIRSSDRKLLWPTR